VRVVVVRPCGNTRCAENATSKAAAAITVAQTRLLELIHAAFE